MPKFKRRTSNRYSKLGKRRKKKQIWRRPTGRDNKMREKRRGYPAVVSVGYKKNKNLKDKLDKKEKIYIYNLKDLKKIGKNQIGIVRNIGTKKKIEIAKEAKKEKIKLHNLNALSYLKKHEKKKSVLKEVKKK